jgi:aspartyl/asparaginyl-tRNA synthetase
MRDYFESNLDSAYSLVLRQYEKAGQPTKTDPLGQLPSRVIELYVNVSQWPSKDRHFYVKQLDDSTGIVRTIDEVIAVIQAGITRCVVEQGT